MQLSCCAGILSEVYCNSGHNENFNTEFENILKVVDGDDWVDTRSFIRLVKLLKEIDADIVASNYTWINHTTRLPEKRQEYPFEKIEITSSTSLRRLLVRPS